MPGKLKYVINHHPCMHGHNHALLFSQFSQIVSGKYVTAKIAYVASDFYPDGTNATWGLNSFRAIRIGLQDAKRYKWAGNKFALSLPDDLVYQANGTNSTKLIDFVRCRNDYMSLHIHAHTCSFICGAITITNAFYTISFLIQVPVAASKPNLINLNLGRPSHAHRLNFVFIPARPSTQVCSSVQGGGHLGRRLEPTEHSHPD